MVRFADSDDLSISNRVTNGNQVGGRGVASERGDRVNVPREGGPLTRAEGSACGVAQETVSAAAPRVERASTFTTLTLSAVQVAQ